MLLVLSIPLETIANKNEETMQYFISVLLKEGKNFVVF